MNIAVCCIEIIRENKFTVRVIKVDLSIKKKKEANDVNANLANYEILLDGKEITGEGLTSMQLELTAGEKPQLIMKYDLDEIEIDGVCELIKKEV